MKKSRLFKFNILELIVVLCVLLVILFIFFNYVKSTDQTRAKIRSLKVILDATRNNIAIFEKKERRYPKSLKELKGYIEENPDLGFVELRLVENILSKEDNNKEYRVLNGEGGLFYNRDNGEIKVNLTKPVKHYKKLYFAKYRNEIPSDW